MRRLFLTTLAAFIIMAGNTLAADANNVPPAKIGVVDMQTIATESDAAKAAKAQLEAKYGKERAALEKQGSDLKKQAESLKNPKTSDDKKVKFLKAKQKLDTDTRNFVRKVEQEEIQLRQNMVTLVFSATYEVARAKGYNFVVDVTAGGVLYADQSMDLTQDVLAEVNKIYQQNKDKKPEQAAPAAAAPKDAKK